MLQKGDAGVEHSEDFLGRLGGESVANYNR